MASRGLPEVMMFSRRALDAGLAVILVAIGCVGLLVAGVPELRLFLALALGCGAILAAALFALHARQRQPRVPPPVEGLEPVQINVATVPIGGGVAGLLVVVGSVGILVAGLQAARWFFATALVSGMLIALFLVRWRREHPAPTTPENTLRRT